VRISLIAAMAKNRVIGSQGDIPWRIPGEQKMFKKITLGHAVIMGRKTFESLDQLLRDRTNIIVTRQKDYRAQGCRVAHDLAMAIKCCPADEKEAFICGGGQLYHEALPLADRIYLTVIPREGSLYLWWRSTLSRSASPGGSYLFNGDSQRNIRRYLFSGFFVD
jgi:dihydrofolate reductase